MKRAGRVSVLTLVVVVAFVIGGSVLLLMTAGESPETAATSFMTALIKGDVPALTKLSFMGDESPQEVKKQWDFAINDAGKNYTFAYRLQGTNVSDATDAAVRIGLIRNVSKPGSYEENYELPMVKTAGHWQVDVRSVNRGLFPALPQ